MVPGSIRKSRVNQNTLGGNFGGPVISNHLTPGGFTWTTYAERLEKAGISWKVYQQKDIAE